MCIYGPEDDDKESDAERDRREADEGKWMDTPRSEHPDDRD